MQGPRPALIEFAAILLLTVWSLAVGFGIYGHGISALLSGLDPSQNRSEDVAVMVAILIGTPLVSGLLLFLASRYRGRL